MGKKHNENVENTLFSKIFVEEEQEFRRDFTRKP